MFHRAQSLLPQTGKRYRRLAKCFRVGQFVSRRQPQDIISPRYDTNGTSVLCYQLQRDCGLVRVEKVATVMIRGGIAYLMASRRLRGGFDWWQSWSSLQWPSTMFNQSESIHRASDMICWYRNWNVKPVGDIWDPSDNRRMIDTFLQLGACRAFHQPTMLTDYVGLR